MKGLVITHKGFEDICSTEINELVGSKSTTEDSCVIFDIKQKEDLCLLCYKAQSVSRVLFLLESGEFSKLEDINTAISKLKFTDWIDEEKTIAVRAQQDTELQTQDIEAEVGGFIIDTVKSNQKFEPKVNLENPDIMFFILIRNDKFYLGVDFAGFDLSKRDYKIFSHAGSIKGTLAYSLMRLSGFKQSGKEKLADPFCKDGTLIVETALFTTNTPINYYRKEKFLFNKFMEFDFNKLDKKIKEVKDRVFALDESFRNLNSAKKNAKIAGVQKSITFSRFEVEWLDTKFEEKSMNSIVTSPPQDSKYANSKETEKRYNEFFYQLKYILAKNGKVVLLMHKTDLLKSVAEKDGFKLLEEREVHHGKEKLNVLVYTN